MTVLPEPQKTGRGRREFIAGWISAAVAILAVYGLFQVSEVARYESWVWALAPVMFLASAWAVWLGLRARRDGEESGRWPAFVGFVIGGFYALMLLIALIGHLLGFE